VQNSIIDKNLTKVSPRLIKKLLGLTAKFKCSRDEGDEVQWYYSKGPLPVGAKVLQSTLNLQIEISLNTAGKYYCFGFDTKNYKPFMGEAILMPIGENMQLLYITVM